MKAKQMFKKLGYEKEDENEYYLAYTLKTNYGDKQIIYFDFIQHGFSCFCEQNNESFIASGNELKAINQQFKELGWLDE